MEFVHIFCFTLASSFGGLGSFMNTLMQNLIARLEKRGIEPDMMAGFVRSLANAILLNPGMNLRQMNKRLAWLGWTDFELDYHTVQLAIASFEAVGPNPYAYGPRTAIGTLMEDPRARAVLLRVLPREASSAMMGLLVHFAPDLSLEAVFGNWMVRAPQVSAEQLSALKARLYAELETI